MTRLLIVSRSTNTVAHADGEAAKLQYPTRHYFTAEVSDAATIGTSDVYNSDEIDRVVHAFVAHPKDSEWWNQEAGKRTLELAKKYGFGTASIYEEVVAAGIPHHNHETDLYIPVNDQTRELLSRYPLNKGNATTFINQVEGGAWYDVPFAYLPAWEKRGA